MLPQSNRLTSYEIPHVMRNGKRYQSHGLTCIVLSGDSINPPRFAFIISARVDKRATARNRMKRLVRSAVQDVLPAVISGTQGIFIVRGKLPDTEYNVRVLVKELLQQARIFQNAKGALK